MALTLANYVGQVDKTFVSPLVGNDPLYINRVISGNARIGTAGLVVDVLGIGFSVITVRQTPVSGKGKSIDTSFTIVGVYGTNERSIMIAALASGMTDVQMRALFGGTGSVIDALGGTGLLLGGARNEDATTLTNALFSKQLQIGVPLNGVTVNGTDRNSRVMSNVLGVVIDDSVYPPVAAGTPVAFGDFLIIEIQPGAIGSPFVSPVTVLEGAPIFTVAPSLNGTFQVGQTITGTSGTALGATSYAYQYFSRPDGNTGNGSAISSANGGFRPVRVIPAGDVNLQYRLRVRAFRGSLFAEFFTPWSATIIAAAATQPTFTAASSFTGTPGVGEVLTAVPGAGTGTVAVQWVANDVNIDGAIGLTYAQRWEDRYKSVKPVVSRTVGSSTLVDTTVLTGIVVTPKLTAAYHLNPAWYDGTVMRWMTPVLYAPYEPGKGGTAKVSAAPSSARIRTIDQRVDAYFRGSLHWANPGTPIGAAIQITGARNVVYMGIGTDGWKTQHISATGRVSFLGIIGSFVAPPQDQLLYGGSETSSAPGFQSTDIQGCYLPTRGTYANPYIKPGDFSSGENAASIKSITRADTAGNVRITFDLTTLPSGFRSPLPKGADGKYRGYLIVYGVQVSAGTTNGLNVDWNTNYEVVSYDTVTGIAVAVPSFVGDGTPELFAPASGASGIANTGKAVVMTYVADNHSDGGQKTKGPGGPTRRHANTYVGNYTIWGIDGNASPSDNAITRSCENIRRYLAYPVQEYLAPVVYQGLSTGSAYAHETTNCYIESVWTGVTFNRMTYPGTAQGNVITALANGNPFSAYGGANYTAWRGGDELGVPAGGDYTPANRNPWTWAPTFAGQRNPINADMTGITITASTVAANAPVGTEIGQLLVTAPAWADGLNDASGRIVIVDYVIGGTDAAKVTQGWSGLLYTASAVTAPITLQVTAVVRDSAANYGAAVQFGPVAVVINPS